MCVGECVAAALLKLYCKKAFKTPTISQATLANNFLKPSVHVRNPQCTPGVRPAFGVTVGVVGLVYQKGLKSDLRLEHFWAGG